MVPKRWWSCREWWPRIKECTVADDGGGSESHDTSEDRDGDDDVDGRAAGEALSIRLLLLTGDTSVCPSALAESVQEAPAAAELTASQGSCNAETCMTGSAC